MTLAAYPLVPKEEVGFRIQVTAANTDDEIDELIDVLEPPLAAVRAAAGRRAAEGRMSRPLAVVRGALWPLSARTVWLWYLSPGRCSPTCTSSCRPSSAAARTGR